jgi:hypothetical protein
VNNEDYSGMTVNERLFTSGRMQEFDETVRRRDSEGMVLILTQLDLTESDARWSAQTILSDPSFYGY